MAARGADQQWRKCCFERLVVFAGEDGGAATAQLVRNMAATTSDLPVPGLVVTDRGGFGGMKRTCHCSIGKVFALQIPGLEDAAESPLLQIPVGELL